jgi:uncharacterized protein (TIGR03118 family)
MIGIHHLLKKGLSMWFRNQRTQTQPMAARRSTLTRRRSPKFGTRIVDLLEDRAMLSHVAHPVVSQSVHALASRQTRFVQTNLVSDGKVPAAVTDPNLFNAWGLAAGPTSPWWVNDNGTGLSTLYNGSGAKQALVVRVPPPNGSSPTATSTPTGMVFNGISSAFLVGPRAPALFIFSTEDGTISGWNPTSPAGPNAAVLEVDNSTKVNPNGTTGAVYKGLAVATTGLDFAPNPRLYATNFHAGTVDVFDTSFHQVNLGSSAFTDRKIPKGFAPFGIQAITVPGSSQSLLFVTYAKQDADKHDDVGGKGMGFVDAFDTNGKLIQRVASRGTLNSPWGIAMAPSNFGKLSGELLVGNFGDGRINAFKLSQGRSHKITSAGQLMNVRGKPITISGLWGLAFGNGAGAGPTNTLFFTAGPNGEADGLFGTLTTA